jgi:hypothetical protein
MHLQLAFYTNPLLTIAQSGNVLTATAGFSNYQWYLNDILLPGANELTLDAGDFGTGMYRVQGLSEQGCIVESNNINVGTISSVKENAIGHVSVYPNPSIDYVHISVPDGPMLAIRVLDVQGRCVSLLYPNSSTYTMNAAFLPTGFYTLVVVLESGWVSAPFSHVAQ